ncbi:hypothetical protein HXX76_006424 [Chlamydomonas incerta]|uniref:tRNA-splicing endonuclease subunit Sen54 N-terminal domain-containing protein n=1 Tax=Chlamydomonas incerta TaxID=51695 RepID=A0A835TDN8_CHLIN|nr:hypothetical protein HXX76_006424 [Chlamydomonas incerta]|eukprot:KAG2436905.1 hypothetical protein HXX76_006424 [Chlamydomonas incerta]
MPVSASVFRRGGPKKELFDVIDADVDESKELDEKLAELTELLHLQKAGKELSAALWRPHLGAAELVKQRKHTARDIGFIRGRRIYLQIEEAVFLVDRGDMLLFAEADRRAAAGQGPTGPTGQGQNGGEGEEEEAQAAGAGPAAGGAAADEDDEGADGGGGGGGGRRGGGLQHVRLLSVQEAFDLMVSEGVPLERYLLYSGLSRSGYLVLRHPSRWLLRREERPEQIWGYGAWARCYGRDPVAPGSVLTPPMQHQLPAADAPPSSHAPAIGSAAGAAAAAAAASGAGAGARAGSERQAAAGVGAAGAGAPVAAATGGCGGPAAAGASRGWWGPMGPQHPMMAGVVEAPEEPGVPVTERPSASLLAAFPLLQPLSTIRSAAPHLLRPTRTAAAAADAADAAAAAAATSGAPATAAAGAVGAADNASGTSERASGVAAAGAAGSSGFVSLGTPRAAAHLVYDVYKPGSFVSRYKAQFPAVHTHVAMCSDSPPALGEMWAADAAAAAAAAGEGGKAGGVTWAAVLNGDIALYSVGQADLLRLM